VALPEVADELGGVEIAGGLATRNENAWSGLGGHAGAV
jgi:hypothetical protein